MNTKFRTYNMSNSTILRLYSDQDLIDIEPEYQRQGEVWTKEKRQLLIDSILNDYDIPKLYFHVLSTRRNTLKHEYAVVDGRQRLETIWGFIDGKFPLAADFEYYDDEDVKAGNMTYSTIAQQYPKLKIRFDSCVLPIVCIETNDTDLIEDMFLRLNEAVSLSSAEKRNAIGGPMAKVIREVANHPFFKSKVRFRNARYQHREVAARLLYIEDTLSRQGRIIDTKKSYLDSFVREYKNATTRRTNQVGRDVKRILDKMATVFDDKDDLLQTQAIIPIYYLVVRDAILETNLKNLSRQQFANFKSDLRENRRIAGDDISQADFDLLEFDRLSVQGTNDATSIKERWSILRNYVTSQKS